MATLLDIINDKEKYPDSTAITLADGVQTTVGEVRKGFMMESDYRKKTADLAAQRRELERRQSEFENARAQAEAQLEELAKEVLIKAQESGVPKSAQEDEVLRELRANPIANALYTKIESLTAKVNELDSLNRSLRDNLKQRDQNALVSQHQRVLAYLKQNDPELDTDALVRFARENYVPRLDLAYRLYTEDKRMKRTVDEAVAKAKKEAMDEAKRLAVQPTIPLRRAAVTLPKDAPKTFDEAIEVAMKDPEVIGPLVGAGT